MTIGRRIPFQYTKETPYAHWRDCLPDYEKELENFRKNLAQLAAGHNPLATRPKRESYSQAPFRIVSGEAEEFTLADGERLFIDRPEEIRNLADELRGLRAIRIRSAGCEDGRPVEIETDKPVQILVAFFDNECHAVTRVIRPEWEWDPILGRALSFGDWGTLSVANHQLPAGRNKIDFGGGAYLIAGFVPDGVPLVSREVNPDENSGNPVDWLFE